MNEGKGGTEIGSRGALRRLSPLLCLVLRTSGGPLVSTADEVISVNAAIICGAQGIPFAIASNTAELMPGEIIQHGRFRCGYVGLGAATTPVPRRIALKLGIAQNSGASITAIEPGSPASEFGLMTGDIILPARR